MLFVNSSGKKTFSESVFRIFVIQTMAKRLQLHTLLSPLILIYFVSYLQDQLFHPLLVQPLLFFQYNVSLIQLLLTQHDSIRMNLVVEAIIIRPLDGIALRATVVRDLLLHVRVKPISAVPVIQVGGMALYR